MTARFGVLTDGRASFLLTGVRVVDPATGSDAVRDLAVLDGRIAERWGTGLKQHP